MPARMSFALPNNQEPTSGPVGIPVNFAPSGGAINVSSDLALEQMQGVIDFVQSIYIDNSANGSSFSIVFSGLQYKVTIPPNKQGIFPVICAAGPLSFTGTSAGNVNVPTIMFNTVTQYFMWG